MKLVRRLHLWLSVFFAPSIVFFALSGLVLLNGWNEGEGGAKPSTVAVRLAQVHKSQSYALPPARVRPPEPPPGRQPDNLGVDRAAARQPAPPRARPHRSAPLKAFFVLMTLALIATTGLGVAVAWSFRKERRLILATLGAGCLVPLVLLLL
ncbi:MAG: hypothetical protein JNK64_03380 [Myxococcales bacterium]|nr:hypothetical protein [Myxococcales bacterium]